MKTRTPQRQTKPEFQIFFGTAFLCSILSIAVPLYASHPKDACLKDRASARQIGDASLETFQSSIGFELDIPGQVGTLYNHLADVNEVVFCGDYVVLALGNQGISVLDVSQPSLPVEKFRVKHLGNVQMLILDGTDLLAGCSNGVVHQLDVSQLPTITITNSHEFGVEELFDIKIFQENHLLLACGSEGFRVASRESQSSDWNVVSRQSHRGSANKVFANGSSAIIVFNLTHYYGGGASDPSGEYLTSDLQFFDLSHPANPIRCQTIPTSDKYFDLEFSGDYIFAFTAHDYQDGYNEQLRISSFQREPKYQYSQLFPRYLYRMAHRTRTSSPLMKVDSLYYLADNGVTLWKEYQRHSWLQPELILVGGDLPPIGIDRYMKAGWSESIDIRDDLIATTSIHDKALRLYTLAQSDSVEQIAIFRSDVQLLDVCIAGNRAFLADANGWIRIADVSNPEMMWEIGKSDSLGKFVDLEYDNGHLYATTWMGGLHIFQFDGNRKLELLGTVPNQDLCYTVAVEDTLAYVADGSKGLMVVNASDPTEPREVGRWDSFGYLYDVVVADQIAYAVDDTKGLVILDVSDSHNPIPVSETKITIGSPAFLEIDDGVAYIGTNTRDGGVAFYDVQDPANPVLVGQYNLRGSIHSMMMNAGILYLGVFDKPVDYLVSVDVSNPSSPVQINQFRSITTHNSEDVNIFGMDVESDFLYVAGRLNLKVISLPQMLDVQEYTNSSLPGRFQLLSTFPNPFNGQFSATVEMPQSGNLKMQVFNVLGRLAMQEELQLSPGMHTVSFDSENMASGIYFLNLELGGAQQTRRIVLVR